LLLSQWARLRAWLAGEEARAAGVALLIKTLTGAVMLLFAYNFTALDAAFGDLRAWFHLHNPDAFTHPHYTRGQRPWYLPLAHWDGQPYLLLSDYGYNHGYDNTSGQQFFPLYPLLIRACSLVLPRAVAAVLLNYLLIAGFALFLYRIGVAYRCRWPLLPVVMVMTFPTAFFTSAIYAEALFLFLLAGFFLAFLPHPAAHVSVVFCAVAAVARQRGVCVRRAGACRPRWMPRGRCVRAAGKWQRGTI